jgi:hypothetical protein
VPPLKREVQVSDRSTSLGPLLVLSVDCRSHQIAKQTGRLGNALKENDPVLAVAAAGAGVVVWC